MLCSLLTKSVSLSCSQLLFAAFPGDLLIWPSARHSSPESAFQLLILFYNSGSAPLKSGQILLPRYRQRQEIHIPVLGDEITLNDFSDRFMLQTRCRGRRSHQNDVGLLWLRMTLIYSELVSKKVADVYNTSKTTKTDRYYPISFLLSRAILKSLWNSEHPCRKIVYVNKINVSTICFQPSFSVVKLE